MSRPAKVVSAATAPSVGPRPYYQHAGITIYHGDCREILPHLSADAVVTDPPYGVKLGEYTGTSRYHRESYLTTPDTPEYIGRVCVPAIKLALSITSRLAMTPGNRCMWMYPKPDDIGIWYNPASTNRGTWGFSYANAFIFYYGKDPHNVGRGMKPNSLSGACDSVAGINHPCPKPLKFARWLVARVSLAGDVILDPFAGSGTTLLAAKSLGLSAVGIEIEERYCEIAAKRLSQELFDWNEPVGTPANQPPVEEQSTRDATTPCWLLAMRDADEDAERHFESLLPAGDERDAHAPFAGPDESA